jgi:hypothetical protein
MGQSDALEVPEGQPHAQPPPGWPYGDPPEPPRASPQPSAAGQDDRPRRVPRRGWYLFGVGLIVLGVVLMVVFIVLAVTEGLRVFSGAVDVRVPGQSQVDLPPGAERMVWARPGDERSCSTTDTAGTDLPIEPSGSVSVSMNGDEWVGVGTFPTGNGHVVIECDGADGVIRIANVFNTWGLVGTILGAVLAPIVFSFAGATVLTVTGVRRYRSS